MKKFMVAALVLVLSLLAVASVASAERGNIGGIDYTGHSINYAE